MNASVRSFALLAILALPFVSTGPLTASTIFRSLRTGDWENAGGDIWELSTDGGSTWTTAAAFRTPGSGNDATIRNGHVITISSTRSVNNLTIESGAWLKADADVPTLRTLRVYGTTVTNDGILGGTGGGNGINIEPATDLGNVTFTGTGTYDVGRLRPYSVASLTVTLARDMTINYVGYGLQMGYAGTTGASHTYIIDDGVTLTFAAGSKLGTGSGSIGGSYPSTLQIDGTVTLNPNGGNVKLTSQSQTAALIINGILNVGSDLTPASGGTGGTSTITVNNGGTLNLGTGTADFSVPTNTITGAGTVVLPAGGQLNIGSPSGVTGNIQTTGLNLSSSANYAFTGTDAQFTSAGLPSTVNNLTVNNAAGVTLTNGLTVNSTLALTNGKITLGSSNLTIGSSASISGGSSSSYVVTNSTGVLTCNGVGVSAVAFPIGTSSTYNPVTINNAGTSDDFSVRVQSAFDSAPPDPNKVVNRQWSITEATAGGSDATITVQWNSADEAAGFVRTDPIYIGRHNGSQWVQTAATFTDLGGGIYTASAGGFASFSPFGVGTEGALPIQMVSSTASVVRGNDIEVVWKTISETNNYGFEVYRKRNEDGAWKKLGFVDGHGTTLTPQAYSYIDKSVGFGKYYYRIKQVDLDGKSEVFPEMMVTVEVAPDKFVLAQNYPNPFNPSTVIEFVVPMSGPATMTVYNVLGQEVVILFDGNAEAGRINTARLNASNLAGGLYFYTLRSAGQTETKRMLLMK